MLFDPSFHPAVTEVRALAGELERAERRDVVRAVGVQLTHRSASLSRALGDRHAEMQRAVPVVEAERSAVQSEAQRRLKARNQDRFGALGALLPTRSHAQEEGEAYAAAQLGPLMEETQALAQAAKEAQATLAQMQVYAARACARELLRAGEPRMEFVVNNQFIDRVCADAARYGLDVGHVYDYQDFTAVTVSGPRSLVSDFAARY